MTYIFYDTETSGLSAPFDQLLQFAAIVTDDDFNKLEDINLRCRLNSYIVASPGAMRVTGVGPRTIFAAPLSLYQMTAQIRAFIERWTPAILIGFNSIGFDENMLRQAFFQNLHPAYQTNTNGNSRMDTLRLAHAVADRQPQALRLPLNESGNPSFRLSGLAAANGINLGNAHDALADAQATLDLTKLLRQRAPQVWHDQFSARSRHAVEGTVSEHSLVIYTDRAFKKSTILACALCANPKNPSAIAMFDLDYDPTEYFSASVDELRVLLKANPRPFRIMKANASPIISPYKGDRRFDIDPEEALRRRHQLRAEEPFILRLAQAMAQTDSEFGHSAHIEQSIYDGFPSPSDRKLMQEFHRRPWGERFELLPSFNDQKYREFSERIIFEEYPEGLPNNRREALLAWRRNRHTVESDIPWLTIAKAHAELDKIRAEATNDDQRLLNDISEYLTGLRALYSTNA
jgi:exodeoxyribonuclease-1